MFAVCLCTCIVVTIITILFRRGYIQYIPFLLKFTIAGFIAEEIILGYGCVYLVRIDNDWDRFEQSKTYKMCFTLGTIVYLSNHWMFTSHYLKVASLFKLTF